MIPISSVRQRRNQKLLENDKNKWNTFSIIIFTMNCIAMMTLNVGIFILLHNGRLCSSSSTCVPLHVLLLSGVWRMNRQYQVMLIYLKSSLSVVHCWMSCNYQLWQFYTLRPINTIITPLARNSNITTCNGGNSKNKLLGTLLRECLSKGSGEEEDPTHHGIFSSLLTFI